MASKYKKKKLTNSVIINYLSNHTNVKIQELAYELVYQLDKKNAPFELGGRIPNIQELSNAVFLQYFKCNRKPGFKKIASKLQKKLTKKCAPYQLEEPVPSLSDVFQQFSISMSFLS